MESNWLTESRKKNRIKFTELPLPSEREEAWRYTDLSAMNLKFEPSKDSSVSIESDNDNIIAEDFATALKKHPAIAEKYFAKILPQNDKISAFHLASSSDGVLIFVPKNESGSVFVAFENCNAHNIIILEAGARLV